MAQLKAIYASVPPTGGVGAWWIGTPPVVVANPSPFWANLEWSGGNTGGSSTVEYTENPQYLWLQPVADPVNTVTATFVRRWLGGWYNSGFTPRAIEDNRYDIIISIAADDQFSLSLTKNSQLLKPSGFSTNVPTNLSWRNVKTYEYEGISINYNAILELETVVTGIGQGAGTPTDSNPTMVTWVMQLVLD